MTPEELAHNKRIEQYAKKVQLLYKQTAREAGKLALLPGYDPKKPFSIENYPNSKAKMDKLLKDLFNQTKFTITEGIDREWLAANQAADNLVHKKSKRPNPPKEWLQHNEEAREAFKARQVAGMNLSTRVWNLTEQFKQELEMAVDVALSEGKSAAALSKDIRQYLNEPDKLFRRVRNKKTGKLQLSKAAKSYHPGRGVYRSSYKNAMRLARTETNMAYRTADHTRHKQLDFVLGFEVHLSKNHPVRDICDDLKGKYPKDFKYVGWHPHCRCFVTTMLMDDDEFNQVENRLLAGENIKDYVSPNAWREVPKGLQTWVKDNAARAQGWANMPYFIRDNFVGGKLTGGLDIAKVFPPVPAPMPKVKLPKTEQQKAEIQAAWNTRVNKRRYDNQLRSWFAQQYNKQPKAQSILDYISSINKAIANGDSPASIKAMMNKLAHKATVKDAWDARVHLNNMYIKELGNLIDNPLQAIAKYGYHATKDVHTAVKAKLDSWAGKTTAEFKAKLDFEIAWVEKMKKYDTWQIAQAAYEKQLIVYEKQLIKESIKDALAFAQTTKSPLVQALADDILTNLAKPAAEWTPTYTKSLVADLNEKVKQLKARQARKASKKGVTVNSKEFDPDAFSQGRKNAAKWYKTKDHADKQLRPYCKQQWASASELEKQAATSYTGGSGAFNRPLRGYYKDWYTYKGVGNVALNAENYEDRIHALTSLLGRCEYDFDMWVQRGVSVRSFSHKLPTSLYEMTDDQLQSLVGMDVLDEAFMSCGTAKSTGFIDEVILNIYCPRGTKMMYAEPYSRYGGMSGGGIWDGAYKTSLHSEFETIIQRGSTMRIIKVEKVSSHKYYIDVEIRAQQAF